MRLRRREPAPPAGDGTVVLRPGPSASFSEAEPADAHSEPGRDALAKERWNPLLRKRDGHGPGCHREGQYADRQGRRERRVRLLERGSGRDGANCVDVMSEPSWRSVGSRMHLPAWCRSPRPANGVESVRGSGRLTALFHPPHMAQQPSSPECEMAPLRRIGGCACHSGSSRSCWLRPCGF